MRMPAYIWEATVGGFPAGHEDGEPPHIWTLTRMVRLSWLRLDRDIDMPGHIAIDILGKQSRITGYQGAWKS